MRENSETFNRKYLLFFCFIFTFMWIGFVCSISFMEAWVKFQAPNLTFPVGLSVGRLVFSALNKAEWVFAALILIFSLLAKKRSNFSRSIFFYIPFSILIIQTYWLLPILNDRVDAILEGVSIPKSSVHFYYLFLEVMKVIFLFLLGFRMFSDFVTKSSKEPILKDNR